MMNPNQTMTAEPESEGEQSETAPVRHIQTTHIGYDESTDKYRLMLTNAIRAAGLDGDAMFRYFPEDVDELGLVPALGMEDDITSPRDGRTYSVAGSRGSSYQLQIPEDALVALGIDPDGVKKGNAPLLDVYAGDRMLAFDKSNAITVPVEMLPDDYEGDASADADGVVLEQIQTTTPTMRDFGQVTARLTAAIRRAGSGEGEDLGGIQFHPERAADLGGVVPATLSKYGDGRARGNTYSLKRVTGNSGKGSKRGFEAVMPESVLAALGLSEDDYEDVPLEDRPALTVYAGDHLLAFGRPGERNVTVDREQTPVERVPSLTDIAGIGPALAKRLPDEGFETVEDLYDATREDLLAIPNLGKTRADNILDDIRRRMEEDGEDQ